MVGYDCMTIAKIQLCALFGGLDLQKFNIWWST